MNHEHYMARCIELAGSGLGQVAPNPMVGCVIVHNEQIIGEGYHHFYGEHHAEVNAINTVKDEHLLAQSTLYVNLEPCSHYGKTPPCAKLILEKKIPRVVIAGTDPNPLVSGQGLSYLQQNGVEVICGILEKEHRFFNRRFLTFYEQKRPYIILKYAQSADGFIAPTDNRQLWLSSGASKELVHQWRTLEQAILIGKNTALADNPLLTVRLAKGKNPLRVLIDKNLDVPPYYNLFNTASPTLVINSLRDEVKAHITYRQIDFSRNILPQLMSLLHGMQIQSLFVEGGAFTLNSFIENDLWDEVRVFTAITELNHGKKVTSINVNASHTSKSDTDTLKIYYRQ